MPRLGDEFLNLIGDAGVVVDCSEEGRLLLFHWERLELGGRACIPQDVTSIWLAFNLAKDLEGRGGNFVSQLDFV